MESVSYSSFSAALHRQMASERKPWEVTIEVSHRCPLECAHCYNNLPMGDHDARSREMTYAEHCRLIGEIADAGCLWVLFTGGEIFARRDFLDIYTYAKRKGLIVTLYTNGTLISPKIADYLTEYRPFSIEITLYGRTRETYERLTGVPGSYDKCLRGIRLLQERNLPLKLKTVAVTINKHELFEMRRFAEEELGCEFRYDSLMSPRIDCSQSPLAVRLSPEEVVEIDIADEARLAEWRKLAADINNPVEWGDAVYHCGAGLSSFAVDPQGRMSACLLSHKDTYDLRVGNVAEGWESFLGKVRARRETRPTKCRTCQLRQSCGMCPANGELENGDAESPVEFYCEVTHLRAHALDLPVPAHGDCEYCADGTRHAELMLAAERLKRRAQSGKLMNSINRFLPVVTTNGDISSGGGCATGGCGSCATASL